MKAEYLKSVARGVRFIKRGIARGIGITILPVVLIGGIAVIVAWLIFFNCMLALVVVLQEFSQMIWQGLYYQIRNDLAKMRKSATEGEEIGSER